MRALLGLVLAIGVAATVRAETINGKDLALVSDAFAGTYVHLDAAGKIVVKVDAPRAGNVAVVVGDDCQRVAGDARTPLRFSLLKGTHFVRIQRSARDVPLAIDSVTIDGGEVRNEHSDANALAAADTYIENYRRGEVTVKLADVAPGTAVRATLVRRAFNFGANSPGIVNKWMIDNAPPGSDEAKFQQFVLEHFNMLVPSNAGKWVYHEPRPGQVSMDYADAILRFAHQHGLRARMHTLIWDTEQQPPWVNDLLKMAANGDLRAKNRLRRAISDRIRYYVGERAVDYDELDVLNESLHRDGYWKVFGAQGIADIYNEVARVARDVNPNLRLYLNEYNVLQWSRRYPFKEGQPDPYANWYREHIEEVIAAGGAVSGIGVQYYVDCRSDAWENSPHSPARIFGVMQNLSTLGLPITLTEFGIGKDATPEQAAKIYDETLRLIHGTPQANGVLIWGFYAGAVAEKDIATALVDKNWNLTPAGRTYDRLIGEWKTDVTVHVAEDRTIAFSGFWGDYELDIEGRRIPLTITKETAEYEIAGSGETPATAPSP